MNGGLRRGSLQKWLQTKKECLVNVKGGNVRTGKGVGSDAVSSRKGLV